MCCIMTGRGPHRLDFLCSLPVEQLRQCQGTDCMPYRSSARQAAQLCNAVAAGPAFGGMPFPTTAPGFPVPAYAVSAPGQAFPQGPAPDASSHQRTVGATHMQVAMQGPTAGRQQPRILLVRRRPQPGMPTTGAQPQQAALVPVQGQPLGPSQVNAHQQQQQAAVVPVQAQAQGPAHVEHRPSSDHMAVQGPSQQAGAAQPWGAQGLQQGSAQPTSQPMHQDRTGQAPVQASGPQQVRAASACTVRSPAAPFGGHQHSASCSPAASQRCCSTPQAAGVSAPCVALPSSLCAQNTRRLAFACAVYLPPASDVPASSDLKPAESDFGIFPASPDSPSEA